MKSKPKKKTYKIPRCPSTVTGEHIWGMSVDEDQDPDFYRVVSGAIRRTPDHCIACQILDDREENK